MPINKFCGLYQAIKHNNIKVVKFFIENNENVEIAAFDGKTPLIIAVGNSYLERIIKIN